jgi:hypothetical protein
MHDVDSVVADVVTKACYDLLILQSISGSFTQRVVSHEETDFLKAGL